MDHGNWAETSGAAGTGDRELDAAQEDIRRELSWEVIAGHRERLMRLVRRRLPNAQDTEDCVHEAMLRAAACGDLDRERIGPFLTSVALRLCVDNHREQERSRLLLPRTADVRTPEIPDEGVCDRDFGRWLLRQVHLLRGRERQVVLARAHGISTLEFARIHQISVKAAEGAFTRGRARLRLICARSMDGVVA
ncbi:MULTISPECIES: RNA polymerase sigma factor [unclassified Streptomyces]|jgi:RNA polymerase sigma-70 factor (ECF subfamily)|uniref:RNA polymerase sigma factor n=1 Tax=unclassified Streptomyces TaxID=2593676 RepID=UPI00117FF41B|nr:MULTISPECIES: sigma-70 family RNA polymerase sigma factor [unclassified Streptomyces]TRO67718.1 sigma-70 family RNA polymerase sigma factor [Streptomyces sp. IB201691-2A2]